MVSRDNGDRWWEGPATLGQLLLAVGGLILTILLAVVSDRIAAEARFTHLEDQARVNADGIKSARDDINEEARARANFDGQVAAKLDAISDRLGNIAVSIAVITAQHAGPPK